ncbi:MAG TPA: hypothetical protein PLW34_08180 [Termitinemataceae bacterium]|nr:hypothetical protein [Termitinemataceae bacterium]HOM23777.1 hypothetical protein [Termitinemataceae bacterium]HPQ00817.1 hypothetical protein [Termitinemataceae bacterium]
MDIQKVIKHAENVLHKIEEYNDAKISKDDLKIVKERIQYMIYD